ncbi:LLM class flavin-dependent oxidoreductase [Nonomuraea sp. NPDC026600]|uniref:LLM class flavin-dependent oxidoreductase n=1 Tax=Nonomuraea sp. NPDC026600 TaxID=3155363 RepID=UPI0033D2B290
MVDAARRALGPVGLTLPVSFTDALSIDLQREAVERLERAGYHAVWTNEVIGGKDALVQLAVLLAATRRMVFGSPLATMRDYRERMDSPTSPPAPDVAYPRIIAANGPKMLALAGEIADGALPAGGPPEFTAQARQVLGPDKLLVVGLSVVPGADRDRTRALAREQVSGSLRLTWVAAALARLGYSEQEIAKVSDRLVDAIIAHGDPADIAAKVREHLAAGADHVTLMQPIGTDFAAGVDQLEWLAPALPPFGHPA